MSSVKSILEEAAKSVVKNGDVQHEFKVGELTIVLGPIRTEERFLGEGMIVAQDIQEKYEYKDMRVNNDMLSRYRSVSLAALSTVSVNGTPPVDLNAPLKDQIQQRKELIMEYMELPVQMVDIITAEMNKMNDKVKAFFKNKDEIEGKS